MTEVNKIEATARENRNPPLHVCLNYFCLFWLQTLYNCDSFLITTCEPFHVPPVPLSKDPGFPPVTWFVTAKGPTPHVSYTCVCGQLPAGPMPCLTIPCGGLESPHQCWGSQLRTHEPPQADLPPGFIGTGGILFGYQDILGEQVGMARARFLGSSPGSAVCSVLPSSWGAEQRGKPQPLPSRGLGAGHLAVPSQGSPTAEVWDL